MLIRLRQGYGRTGMLKREEKWGWEEARELPGEMAFQREATWQAAVKLAGSETLNAVSLNMKT